MTHSLHRKGLAESLRKDYVVFVFGAPGTIGQHKKRLRRKFPTSYAMFKSALAGYKTTLHNKFPRVYAMTKKALFKLGMKKMLKIQEPKQKFRTATVLNSKEELVFYLKQLKEANTGQSVVVSGLFDEVISGLKEIDLLPHTVQFSLGCFGRTELLPKDEILEVTTMCGHHLVSPRLVERLANDIGKGKITKEEAAKAMGKLCVCGIFNEARAAEILKTLAIPKF